MIDFRYKLQTFPNFYWHKYLSCTVPQATQYVSRFF